MRSPWGWSYKGPGPTALAPIGRLSDDDVKRQERDYVRWLAPQRGMAEDEAERYARSWTPWGARR